MGKGLHRDYPILEFDPTRRAIIEPGKIIKRRDVSEHCVFTYFREVAEKVREELDFTSLKPIKSEMGEFPLYQGQSAGKTVTLFHCPVGAPLAAATLEEIIARGGRKFIVCGGAGVLDSTIPPATFFIPLSALRDEGTSYHYLPPARDVKPNRNAVNAIKRVFRRHQVDFMTGTTWTTDAFYRETPSKIRRRQEEGCLMVEMEAAAFFAVARFRKVQLAQILYAGDDVSGSDWDPRNIGKKIPAREALFKLALEACLEL